MWVFNIELIKILSLENNLFVFWLSWIPLLFLVKLLYDELESEEISLLGCTVITDLATNHPGENHGNLILLNCVQF